MNRILHRLILFTLCWLWLVPVEAQTALNPNDPVITYDSTHPPATPVYTQITKWVRTVRMSYNTDSYKCYIYKNMAFRLKFPKTYVPGVNDGKKYPMYLFFHGVGEKGTIYDNEYQLLWGGQTWASRVDNGTFDGFLIYPQSQGGYWGPNDYDNLKEVVDSIVASCKGDPDRLSVNGLSGGGWGTWEFLMRYPQLTADALPMSAMALAYQDSINRYKFTPIWLFQGGQDGNPAPYTTNVVVSAIQAAGGNIKLTTYPNDAHNTWIDAWNEPDFAPFMLRANRLNPYPLYGKTTFCPGDTITLGLAPGALQYEWQKDGVTIYTGTSNFISVLLPGSYRVRMQLPNGWTGWTPTPLAISYKAPAPIPVITTNPALASNVLPAPDGSTSITLQVPAGMSTYQWQQGGSSSILSTTNTLTTSTPGAYYVRVQSSNSCISSASDTFRVINANGGNAPDPIGGLVVSSFNQVQIVLSWTENQTPAYKEKYFEIYRGTQSGGPYTFVGRANANIDTYTDNGLIPGTSYFYKVRPVNDNAAGPVSAEVKGTTIADTIPPSAPPSLTVTSYTNNQVVLSWNAATDNVGVTGYDIYANGTLKMSVGNVLTGTVTGLTDGTLYNFYVKAKDAAGNRSTPSNQVTVRTLKANLSYKLYTGSWSNLPNFNTLTPTQTGKAYVPDLSVVPAGTTTNFALMWTGYIRIPVTGSYTFTTYSDDGSKLYFNKTYSYNTTATVNNDGAHAAQYASGTVNNVAAGVYPITITYFQAGGADTMQVYWTSTAAGITTQQLIPSTAFIDTSAVNGNPPAAPSGLTVTVNNFSKLNLKWTSNSTNQTGFEVYRGTSATGPFNIVTTTAANAVTYTDTALQASTTYYYQVRAIGTYGESAYTATASATTAAKPLPPAMPTNLVVQALSTTALKLTWTDTATNATGFEIQRSLADSLHFSLMTTTGPVTGQSTYSDTTLAANMVAYYKVRAAGIGGYSAFTPASQGVTLNIPPKITKIPNQTIRYGTVQNIPVIATDADNDSISFSLYNMPAFASLQQSNGATTLVLAPTAAQQGTYNNVGVIATDSHNGTDTTIFNLVVNNNYPPVIDSIPPATAKEGAVTVLKLSLHDLNPGDTFTWTGLQLPAFATLQSQNDTCLITLKPGYTDAGTYTLKVQATDSAGGIDTRSFTLTVVTAPSPNYSIFINFKLNNNPPLPWNNVFGSTTTALKDSSGQVTNVGLKFDESWWAAGTEGATTGNNTGVYPDAVMAEYLYFGSLPGFFSGAPSMHGHITGLEKNRTYTVKFFSSSKWWAPQPDNGSTQFTINGVNQTLYVQNNTTNRVIFQNLKADTSGEIKFTLSIPAGGQVGYLNAMELNALGTDTTTTVVNQPPVITKIANQTMTAGTSLTVPVSATDPDGDVITYSTKNLPSFGALTKSGTSWTVAFNPSVSNAGSYNNISIIATDTYGAADTTTFNLTVSPSSSGNGSYKVLMHFRLNNDAPAPWNNITGSTTTNLKNDQGLATGIGLKFDESWWAAGIEGATTGNNSGVYPDVVLAEYLYFGALPGFFSGAPVMHGHITGLSANTTYTMKFLSDSKWWAPQPDNGSTQFTVNGVVKTLYAQNNTSNTADFTNLTADANGEIQFILSIPTGGQVGYLNALELDVTPNTLTTLTTTTLMMADPAAAKNSLTTNSGKSGLQVNVYPNPFVSDLAIDLTLKYQAPSLLIEVVSLSGKRVYSEVRREVPQGRNLIRINTQNTVNTPGIYFLRLTSSTGETSSTKLLKQE